MRPRVRLICDWSIVGLGVWVQAVPETVLTFHVGPLSLDLVWLEVA